MSKKPAKTTKKQRKGKIYQLVNMITNEKYIGSTIQSLNQRKRTRIKSYNKWLKNKSYCKSHNKLFINIQKYGWDNFRIELLQSVEFTDRDELFRLEGEYIRHYDTYNNGLNTYMCKATEDEKRKRYNEYMKVYMRNYNKKKKQKKIIAKNNKEAIKNIIKVLSKKS